MFQNFFVSLQTKSNLRFTRTIINTRHTMKHLLLSTLLCCGMSLSAQAQDTLTVASGHQTTGVGNKRTVLFRVALPAGKAEHATLKLSVDHPDQLSQIQVHMSQSNEWREDVPYATLATVKAKDYVQLHCKLPQRVLHQWLWITADVAESATPMSTYTVQPPHITFRSGRQSVTPVMKGAKALTTTVFAVQHTVFTPLTEGSRFYRIPAIITAGDTLVAVADKRFDSQSDLGHGHKIDVVRRFSTDGGHTWSAHRTIAQGDGQSASACGFGDPALVRCKNGKLICLMAAGSDGFFGSMRHCFMVQSSDGGNTWTRPVEITSEEHLTDRITGQRGLGVHSIFVTSGRGVITTDGRVMFLAVVKRQKNSPITNHLLYSDDNGQTWTLDSAVVYHNGNEAKLLQRRDGRILASIRTQGARGFNLANEKGEVWHGQWTNNQLTGAHCNAEMLPYRGYIVHSLLKDNQPRRDLRLYMSYSDGEIWREMWQIQPGLAGYSTLTQLPNGDLGVFYEDGTMDNNGYRLNFVTIPVEEMNGAIQYMNCGTY